MQTLPLTDIIKNPHNSKDVSPEGFQRTKKQVLLLGQFKPLILNKENMLIGGHTRREVFDEISRMEPFDIQDYVLEEGKREIPEEMAKRIIEKAKNPRVEYIDFVQSEDGVWRAWIDGDEQPKTFSSKEQAIMEYALADNDESGHYTTDIMSLIDQFQINPNDYAVLLDDAPTLQDLIPTPAEEVQTPEKKPKEIECPACHEKFTP